MGITNDFLILIVKWSILLCLFNISGSLLIYVFFCVEVIYKKIITLIVLINFCTMADLRLFYALYSTIL